MAGLPRWMRISLQVVGAATIIVGICGLIFWVVFVRPFRNFVGGNCTDTEERVLASPSGKQTVKSFHRECGTYHFYFVYLSTGNPNSGYEYTPIVELKNLAPGQASVSWDSADQLSVNYPSSSEVVEGLCDGARRSHYHASFYSMNQGFSWILAVKSALRTFRPGSPNLRGCR
jgi:hypothetical protein